MRVTDSQLYDTTRRSLNRAKESLARAQEQASSGLRVQKPSDDPLAAAAARRERHVERMAEAGQRGAEVATVTLQGADETLNQIQDLLARVRELATQGASGTTDPASMKAQLSEVVELRKQLISAGNTQVAGSFLFGGFRDDAPPFDATGQYSGDDTVKSIEVLPGVRMDASVRLARAVGVGGGVDVFATLDKLAMGLGSGDHDAVRATLSDLILSEKQVTGVRAEVGSALDGLEIARAVVERQAASAVTEHSRLVDADEVSAISDLMRAKSALDAAIATAGQIPAGGLAGRGR